MLRVSRRRIQAEWLKLKVIIRRTSSCQSRRGAEDFRQEEISDYLQLLVVVVVSCIYLKIDIMGSLVTGIVAWCMKNKKEKEKKKRKEGIKMNVKW